MKRHQINRHRLTWLVLPLVMLATIIGAVMVKPTPDATLNDALPTTSFEAND